MSIAGVDMTWTAIVTLFALAVYFVLGFNVGRARVKFRIRPPVMDGPPAFLQRYRAHQNTLEFLPLFLPLLWLGAFTVGDLWAAAIGLLWPVGRIVYAVGYYEAPEKRMPGFLVSLFAIVALWIASLGAILADLLAR